MVVSLYDGCHPVMLGHISNSLDVQKWSCTHSAIEYQITVT